MSDAAATLHGTEKTTDVRVSVDSTWQIKGFPPTFGVVKAISIDSGKVLDAAILGLVTTISIDSWKDVAILYFNNGEKAALDIMELLKNDPGYYMTKYCRSVNMRRKRSSIYRM